MKYTGMMLGVIVFFGCKGGGGQSYFSGISFSCIFHIFLYKVNATRVTCEQQ